MTERALDSIGTTDPEGKGWFEIPGAQKGDRTLKEQIRGLGTLLKNAQGKTVLDLGCAEGLIAKWLVDHGAAGTVHGCEIVASRVEHARHIFKDYDAKFNVVDLENLAEHVAAHAGEFLPRYDIVLLLSIAHKFRHPDRFLNTAAKMCGDWLAIRLPDWVLCDARSRNKAIDIPTFFRVRGFKMVEEQRGPRKEWVGLFRRA